MNKHILLLVFGIVLLFAGCSNLPTPTATLEAIATEAAQNQITVTPSRTSTFSPEPSLTLTKSVTHTLKPFSTEPIGECRLPCWWGITPGVTTWDDALAALDHFKDITISNDSVKVAMQGEENFVRFRISEEDIVGRIFLSNIHLKGVEYYDLLAEYGEPSDIYLFTWKDFQTRDVWLGKGERPARIIFYYAGMGILAEYEFFGKLDDTISIITICPNVTEQKLRFDPYGTEFSQSEISQIFLGGDGVPILKIDEATSLTKHDFYSRYKDKNQTGCFETPASIWY
jgi:hypothetical protein